MASKGARTGTPRRGKQGKGREIPDHSERIDAERPTAGGASGPADAPRGETGFTVFFTGLPGAGKSTIGAALRRALMERGRTVTVLDGDEVRGHLSSELGFSKAHRDLNIRRIAFVAREVTRHRGVAVCAPIAPYADARRYAREIIGAVGGFIEVHVSTPLALCEERDPKGLYAKARAGLISGLTGIDDPYETPEAPDLRIDTTDVSVAAAVGAILDHLHREGYLVSRDRGDRG